MGISYFNPLGSDTVPDFISARTPQALRREMFRNNIRHKGFVVYQDIVFNPADSRWYAWYYVKLDTTQDQIDVLQGAE